MLLVDRLIDLESGDLLGCVLRELLFSDLNLTYVLVGNVLLINLYDLVVKIFLEDGRGRSFVFGSNDRFGSGYDAA